MSQLAKGHTFYKETLLKMREIKFSQKIKLIISAALKDREVYQKTPKLVSAVASGRK